MFVNSDLPLGLRDTAPSCLLPTHYRASLLNTQMRLFLFSSQSFKDKEPTETYGSHVTTRTHTHTLLNDPSVHCAFTVCPGNEGTPAPQQSSVSVCKAAAFTSLHLHLGHVFLQYVVARKVLFRCFDICVDGEGKKRQKIVPTQAE